MKTPLRLLFTFITVFTFSASLTAQDCATSTERYTGNLFGVTQRPPAIFGRNAVRSYSTNTNYAPQDLYLDFYEPTGDVAVKRPLVILAFGGGFIEGTRADMKPVAEEFAKKGYTVASIDYRIVTNTADQQALAFATSDDVKRTIVRDIIIKAVADMKAAIRFFKEDAANLNSYKIDTTKIFIGGASAGAIAALHAAYLDNVSEDPNLAAAFAANGGFEGNTDLPGKSLLSTYHARGIAGVINISGAVMDTTIIDANDPPVYNAHGDKDPVIPYKSGIFSVPYQTIFGTINITIPVTFYGGQSIKMRADNIGLKSQLYTIVNGLHETPGEAPYINNIICQSASFMQPQASASPLPVKLVSFTVRARQCNAEFSWQTAEELQSSHYEIETSGDGVSFTKAATVTSRNAANGAAYTYQLQGITKAVWVRLKMVDMDGAAVYSRAQRYSPRCNSTVSVQVYPNPAQSSATVAGLEAGMLVDVLTADGKVIWSHRAAGNTQLVPVGQFAKGLLLVQVKTAEGTIISSTKLMKN